MKIYDKLYNSAEKNGFEEFQLASGHISSTTIYFEAENLYVQVNAEGYVEISDADDELLAFVYIPKQTGGKETYNDVFCGKEEDTLILRFPIVKWIDNYPHCDGEYDRWDTRTIGYHTLKYVIKSDKITVEAEMI